MIYAIASGKGGTGKTTVTASLAEIWDHPLTVVDLDVEEPNLHLFLNPVITGESKGLLEVPELDPALCTLCGECAAFCQYKALSVIGKKLLVFPEMCHGCGGCLALCPEGALRPGGRELGTILEGRAGNARFLMGRLRVGEAMSPPLMRQVKQRLMSEGDAGDVLIDAPPGVSCPAVNAVMDADCIVLVTEPTPFGLHDFKLAVEAFTPLGKQLGAVINRAGIGDGQVKRYCLDHGLPVWAEIPYSRAAAQAYSQGKVISREIPELRKIFIELAEKLFAAISGLRKAGHA
ncbi:MinD superfamily P-loop ATPase, contains an inserted ferredoxin domain [Desulfonatronum thiosulfatophilum]|uniref:MinD superfamily P-loop ATPase, contains an inserted ferredoxin domain n=1 Tax=Desulfonatronum thiosulfatophilum TaxID=617002 RepID=A0A1G6CXL1_9BACT|nr:ATP-binding protein [Desulfonatronum thiosulfatophilum]SDB37616.1 MinD superfamily P-loop ATPase, contains an inserted ferredoxin domain [Desulfonatronum thiosulfatophilum]